MEHIAAGKWELPDLLTGSEGERITTREQWQLRRPEILELFRQHVYGRNAIDRPAELRFETVDRSDGWMDGRAVRKQINIVYEGPGGTGVIRLLLFIPADIHRPVPAFLLINNREEEHIDPDRTIKSAFWPAEYIVSRGYAAAAFHVADVDPDDHDGFINGVHGIFDPPGITREGDAWGTIAAWAWGASRVMDYLAEDPDIDANRVAVVGHSRGGKTALWCGAQDDRFAMVVSNNSGCGGAAVSRGKQGETVQAINEKFPHWFSGNFKSYNGKENDLPVDQHMLLALAAPRLLYVTSATEDTWADPDAEYWACTLASPVYELYGLKGLAAAGRREKPDPGYPLQEGRIAYHLRAGKHDLTEYDWSCFIDAADRHLQ
ncbi:alpha/beta hydrolase family protein [Paenibacillus thalictri]|uniref:Acetylxylan esterase n=1 Tax=Paenibacillus thalictri TaxID=2527873 RepID=A0A4Q9DGX2_9BACL|nr:prolyl oligopeptidase family serine peptidase [Paenibacillus thalictri]TBL71044.1 acetylxylan esterase [Paenibacillus thalictri]